MADASVLANKLSQFVAARGWDSVAHRFTVEVVEPAFTPTRHTWLAGTARTISDAEVRRVRPTRLVVEDFAPAEQHERLRRVMEEIGHAAGVSTYSRFLDYFWNAEAALVRAFEDSKSAEVELDSHESNADANLRHVTQLLYFGNVDVPDHRALEFGLPDAASCLAVEADAGLGKSELLKWHEWRYATMYKSALRGNALIELPPIALRVPLRDFKSLSLDYIAHSLSQPSGDSRAPSLPAISSGAFLRELLIQRRLILLLDGLDEVSGDSDMVDSGVLEWRRTVADGARLVVTSRRGHTTCRAAIGKRFHLSERAVLHPMKDEAGLELLEKRGTEPERARRLVDALSGPARNIPLFLLLAKAVDLDQQPDADAPASRTLTLWRLLELFCERDSDRLGVEGEAQMQVLTQIAEWQYVGGDMSVGGLLESLGVDARDPFARVVDNPHALLMFSGDTLVFKYREFEALFTARAIVSAWTQFGFHSAQGMLRSRRLEGDVTEFAARFIQPASIAGAWSASSLTSEASPLLRRNILAVALAMVDDMARASSAKERADLLAGFLGNREVEEVSLSGLYLERFDFFGWTFRRVSGPGGTFSYCDNLWRSDFDESVGLLQVEGQGFEEPPSKTVDQGKGIRRLGKVIRPMRRRNGRGITSIMSVEEARDTDAWSILVSLGLAVRSGKAKAARWTLTPEGMDALTSFWAAEMRGSDDVNALIDSNSTLRDLIIKLGS